MKSTTKKNAEIAGAVGAVGVGLAALAAGAIFLYGKGGEKRRKAVKSWMLKAKGEVLEKLENLEDFSQSSYNRIVDEVASRYKQAKNIDPTELTTMVSELKGHFDSIKKQLTKPTPKKRKVTTTAKKK